MNNFKNILSLLLNLFFCKGFDKINNGVIKNDKLITAELICCFNKIIKNLNESNLFYLIAKK